MIDIHTHKTHISHAVQSLFHDAPIPESGLFSIGIHPWQANNIINSDWDALMSISHNNRMIAIGECGLDKIQGPSLAQQIFVFKKHIEWSEKTKKPIIIHCVKAFNELMEIKTQFQPKQTWIIHGYYSKDEILKKLLSNGCYVSLGTNLLTKDEKLSNYLKIVPVNRLFFESDESEIPVSQIYQATAKILHIDLVHLRQQILLNFTNCFHLEPDALA